MIIYDHAKKYDSFEKFLRAITKPWMAKEKKKGRSNGYTINSVGKRREERVNKNVLFSQGEKRESYMRILFYIWYIANANTRKVGEKDKDKKMNIICMKAIASIGSCLLNVEGSYTNQ